MRVERASEQVAEDPLAPKQGRNPLQFHLAMWMSFGFGSNSHRERLSRVVFHMTRGAVISM
jgi:hypothetical protein